MCSFFAVAVHHIVFLHQMVIDQAAALRQGNNSLAVILSLLHFNDFEVDCSHCIWQMLKRVLQSCNILCKSRSASILRGTDKACPKTLGGDAVLEWSAWVGKW